MCKESKPKAEFRTRGGSQKHLLKSRCNTCLYKEHKKWTESNEEVVREYRAKDKWTLKKRCARHNISVGEFWALFDNQDGSCAVCDTALVAEDSAIDHNHSTGEVRGILCKPCNRGLGLLKDNPENLFRAYEYLRDKGHYG
jgi:hypothetical protein